MIVLEPVSIIEEMSQVSEAKRRIHKLTNELAFSEDDANRAAMVVLELGTNLIKHARGGKLIFQVWEIHGMQALVILSIDSGPGIFDLNKCLEDGFSTAGSLGSGLGAVFRASQFFDAYSIEGSGSVVLSIILPTKFPKDTPIEERMIFKDGIPKRLKDETQLMSFGSILTPKREELVIGDSWGVSCSEIYRSLLVVDGLGHGSEAADAAAIARSNFTERPFQAPKNTLLSLHKAMSGSRGGVAAHALIDREAMRLHFAGLGNINASLILAGGKTRHLTSLNGTLGYEAKKIQEFAYEISRGDTLIMHSDGCSSRWNLHNYPELLSKHPAIICGVLYKDFAKDFDDVTICCLRCS